MIRRSHRYIIFAVKSEKTIRSCFVLFRHPTQQQTNLEEREQNSLRSTTVLIIISSFDPPNRYSVLAAFLAPTNLDQCSRLLGGGEMQVICFKLLFFPPIIKHNQLPMYSRLYHQNTEQVMTQYLWQQVCQSSCMNSNPGSLKKKRKKKAWSARSFSTDRTPQFHRDSHVHDSLMTEGITLVQEMTYVPRQPSWEQFSHFRKHGLEGSLLHNLPGFPLTAGSFRFPPFFPLRWLPAAQTDEGRKDLATRPFMFLCL